MPEQSDVQLDPGRAFAFCRDLWNDSLLAELSAFIEVPALSPAYDRDWEQRGLLDQTAADLARWAESTPVEGLTAEVLREPGRTPVVFVDIPGTGEGTILFYGHLDKQPGGQGWGDGLGPWKPVFDGTRLYGRGGADDGYAAYATLAAVMAVDDQSAPRPRCVGVFETAEESGSPDLDHWLTVLAPRIGTVDLLMCLDSGAGDYDRLWLVTSLRGHCGGRLDVQVLDQGAHSGDAGGVVPSSFRVLRRLLDRLEDSDTGRLLPESFNVATPPQRRAQAEQAGAVLGRRIAERFSWHGSAGPVTEDPAELLLNRAWRPSLSVTGADGLPHVAEAGNVLRPSTGVKLSLRLPPTVSSAAAVRELQTLLEADPPYGMRVRFTPDTVLADGWNAREMQPWLHDALDRASRDHYDGAGLAMIGQGGTIPLMGILQRHYPDAQVLACGVQGPGTNAHGPNESLHLPYTHRLTASLASVLPALCRQAGTDTRKRSGAGPASGS
ncbi:M20/M25/M40 family metallo-hydrolase [Streptomyces sp. NPDC048590]|uniref:M20/M25/M40 family metallo-hydrolase n=1 Tax=Streptomyces sp. NPDC048590 TaxID=3365574 RepID=UPI00371871BA